MSKTLERAFLADIDADIEAALKANKERQRLAALAAPEPAKKRHAALESAGGLTVPHVTDTAESRVARQIERNKAFGQAVSAYAAKERQRQQRRNAAPPEGDIAPTPERMRKASEGMAVGSAVKTHQTRTILNQYGRVIPAELIQAGTQLICDWLTAEAGPRVVGGYDGVPSGVSGARHGGVADHVREAQSTVTLIQAEMHPEFLRVIEWFLTCTTLKPDGSTMRLEDAGQRVSPWTPVEKHQGIGFGMFYMTLAAVARFYSRQRALGRSKQTPSPQDVKALLTAGYAQVQKRREQYQREEEARKKQPQRGSA